MRPQLPDFSTSESVYVLGAGPSLRNYTPESFSDSPTVGCNSVMEFIKLDVWCSAHAALSCQQTNLVMWLNSRNYGASFFMRKFISSNVEVDMVEPARRLLWPDVFKNIFWVDRIEIAQTRFEKEPFEYEIPLSNPIGFSSSILAVDIALRLGARQIILVGYDYIVEEKYLHWHGKDYISNREDSERDYKRLLNLHIEYFKDFSIPVIYRGANPILKELHKCA